jgi:Meiotically up-regulated gene 113
MARAWGKDLYIITAGELTKVGRSQHPLRRLKEIARGMPFAECRLWAVFPNAGPLEAGLHRELGLHHEKRGDWYRCPVEQIAQTVVARLNGLECGP